MEHARKKKDYLHVELLESAVIYLRHTKNTPDKLTVEVSAPNGQKMTYESKVIKVQNYTKSVIFRKKLLLFLPFYVMLQIDKYLQPFAYTWRYSRRYIRMFT